MQYNEYMNIFCISDLSDNPDEMGLRGLDQGHLAYLMVVLLAFIKLSKDVEKSLKSKCILLELFASLFV